MVCCDTVVFITTVVAITLVVTFVTIPLVVVAAFSVAELVFEVIPVVVVGLMLRVGELVGCIEIDTDVLDDT